GGSFCRSGPSAPARRGRPSCPAPCPGPARPASFPSPHLPLAASISSARSSLFPLRPSRLFRGSALGLLAEAAAEGFEFLVRLGPLDQVGDLVDHPADGRRVLQYPLAADAGQPQAAQCRAVPLGVSAHSADQLHFQRHVRLPAPPASRSAPCRAGERPPRGCGACAARPRPPSPRCADFATPAISSGY